MSEPCTLTISSGVHLGVQDDGAITQAWFDGSPTVEFSTFTVTAVPSLANQQTGGQEIQGHAGLWDEPIVFTFERRARDVLTNSLAANAVKGLLNGSTRRTLSGFQDAVIMDGRLCQFAWTERNNTNFGSPHSFSVWGIYRVITPTVRGRQERMSVLVYPCHLVYYTGTDNVSITPDAYGDLDGGS